MSNAPESNSGDQGVSEAPSASSGQEAAAPQVAEPTPAAPTPTPEPAATAQPASEPPAASPSKAGGPISLEKIRQLRKSQQKSAPLGRPAAIPAASKGGKPGNSGPRPKSAAPAPSDDDNAPQKAKPAGPAPKVAVPSIRNALPKDLEDELEAAIAGSDLDSMLVGDSMLQVGRTLTEGQRVQAKVMKTQGEFIFVSLGGPDEGMIPALQFETLPEIGSQVDVIVRGYLADEGMYEATLPGNAVDVSDWDDIKEGDVIEVQVTGSNTGGLECKVGSIRGFIPASQVAEYRVENLGEFVDQKVLCVVTEANQRRGNLVLSRRAVLERERTEKRAERLASLEVGAAVEGTVRKIMDFGAFVDIGGLDGLLHISQLSWERVKHPSEILEEGQQVQVRVDKIDEQTGKIGLSYRSLQDNPWSDIDAKFPIGSVVKGTVTRIAEFGAFVKITTGVEGLVHLSELAHHRVATVSNVVSEGEEVSVKVLSIDAEQQRISLSIKGATAAPQSEATEEDTADEPPPKPVLPKHRGPLKGGTGRPSGGEQFGLKW